MLSDDLLLLQICWRLGVVDLASLGLCSKRFGLSTRGVVNKASRAAIAEIIGAKSQPAMNVAGSGCDADRESDITSSRAVYWISGVSGRVPSVPPHARGGERLNGGWTLTLFRLSGGESCYWRPQGTYGHQRYYRCWHCKRCYTCDTASETILPEWESWTPTGTLKQSQKSGESSWGCYRCTNEDDA
jgi:hypothetical protein